MRMMHRPPEVRSCGLYLQRAATADVVIEHYDAIGTERGFDDVGALGVVAAAHVTVVVEAAYPRWPPSERRTVLVDSQGFGVAYVLDLHAVTLEAHRLGFATRRCLMCVDEGVLHSRNEKVDLGPHRQRFRLHSECARHVVSPQFPVRAQSRFACRARQTRYLSEP